MKYMLMFAHECNYVRVINSCLSKLTNSMKFSKPLSKVEKNTRHESITKVRFFDLTGQSRLNCCIT